MVYLIDDKKIRQEKDYNWTSERFNKYAELVKPIYTLDELEKDSSKIFKEGNIIMYHESFLDKTELASEAAERRSKMDNFARNIKSYLIIFSGGKSSRDLDRNIATLPVSVLYRNLEAFLKQIAVGKIDLEYLLFGENPIIERELSDRISLSLIETLKEQAYTSQGNNLFIRPPKQFISAPSNFFVEKIIYSKDTSDEKLSEKVNEWMNENRYDNIFIPLCFGNILSDFNGLRLACHVRCTPSINQTSRIFLYGVENSNNLLQNEYFNILRIKNTYLLPFSKKTICESTLKSQENFLTDELPWEIEKLKLNIPPNYYDNHSIANEWGIYQMARNADIDIKEITGFDISKIDSLYFKWLIAKNNLIESIPVEQKKIQREYLVKIEGLKVLGKIELPKIR